VLTAQNVHRLRTRLVPQGANLPCTPEAEQSLHERGVWCIPDFIANAGGVICAALEQRGATQETAFAVIREKVRDNTQQVLAQAAEQGILPRTAALRLATERVRQAMSYRRWSIS
jgi:glutamate dehydrogenase (NAD(P)+)